MDCAEEISVLKREVGPLVGGDERLNFDLLNGVMTIESLPTGTSDDLVIQAIRKAGLDARAVSADERAQQPPQSHRRDARILLTALSGASIVAALVVQKFTAGSAVRLDGSETATLAVAKALFGTAVMAGVWLVLPKAMGAIRRWQPDMNLLMTIAVAGAIGIGEWFEAATVAFLFSLSLLLESWSVGRARRAVAALMDLAPPTARVKRPDGSSADVDPALVDVDSMIVVKPGERFPLDGRVVEGASDVNQSPITGESVPVSKSAGDEVYAGTINGDGALSIRTTKPAADTTLAKIIRMVGDAQAKRGPSEQWVEKFARVYTPIVMAAAALVLVVPPLAFGAAWSDWLYRALVLLVIACPCALVISTPVTIVAGLASAARQGVLVKGGAFLEAPAQLVAVALDKTGTLTAGRPKVVEVVPLSGHDERELVERAAALEQHSEHPIARAILQFATEKGIAPLQAVDFQAIKGKGARALFDGREFWLGSHRYVEERGQETPEVHQRIESLAGAGRTIVVIGNQSHVCGLIAIADEIRPAAREVLSELRDQGIAHIVMLTGDNRPTAEAVGRTVGVDEVLAELLPEDKVAAVESLVARFGRVAMVGDGVNDAPALARATLGIAMGSAGSDAAIETADIALMSDDLSRLPWLIQHSRRTLRVIRQNIWFSLAVKVAFVFLTMVGKSSLWAAIAADTGASILVIANGLRLLQPSR
jgi:Cd2+/Zn2+-exporting ATPase